MTTLVGVTRIRPVSLEVSFVYRLKEIFSSLSTLSLNYFNFFNFQAVLLCHNSGC